MNFFPVLAGTCAGTKIFSMLTRHARAARAILHLAALSFLMSLIISACWWFSFKERVSQVTGFIQEQTGGISVTDSGIRTVSEPDKAKYLLVIPNLELKYIPEVTVKTDDINIDKEAGSGIIWTPGIVALWVRKTDNNYVFVPLIWSISEGTLPQILYKSLDPVSKTSLAEKLTKGGNVKGPFNIRPQKGNIKQVFTEHIALGGASGICVLNFLNIIIQTLFFALIFSLIFGFTGRRNARTLPFNRLLAIVIYASFPPIIIGSIFLALDLPIDYQTVFLFCYVCYLMAVMLRVERALTPDIDKPEL